MFENGGNRFISDGHKSRSSAILIRSELSSSAPPLLLIILLPQNGGTNCPACRGLSTVAMPFRGLQSVINTLLCAAPHKARTERERQQADEIYKAGHSLCVSGF